MGFLPLGTWPYKKQTFKVLNGVREGMLYVYREVEESQNSESVSKVSCNHLTSVKVSSLCILGYCIDSVTQKHFGPSDPYSWGMGIELCLMASLQLWVGHQVCLSLFKEFYIKRIKQKSQGLKSRQKVYNLILHCFVDTLLFLLFPGGPFWATAPQSTCLLPHA